MSAELDAGPEPDDDLVPQLDLLGRAQALQRSAISGDVDAVRAELCTLRNAIAHHEQDALAHHSPLASRVVTQGQQQLRDLVDRLLGATVAHGGNGNCTCLAGAVELTRLLMRQARLEADIIRSSAPLDDGGGRTAG
jgi:hypothetical protein